MIHPVDKREFPRVKIPETKVYYKKDIGFELFRQLSGPVPLKDIGMGGACFEVRQILEWGDLFYGDPIYLQLVTRERKKIQIKGNVRWISGSSHSDSTYIGLEFTGSGDANRANSRRSFKRLEKLTQDFN